MQDKTLHYIFDSNEDLTDGFYGGMLIHSCDQFPTVRGRGPEMWGGEVGMSKDPHSFHYNPAMKITPVGDLPDNMGCGATPSPSEPPTSMPTPFPTSLTPTLFPTFAPTTEAPTMSPTSTPTRLLARENGAVRFKVKVTRRGATPTIFPDLDATAAEFDRDSVPHTTYTWHDFVIDPADPLKVTKVMRE